MSKIVWLAFVVVVMAAVVLGLIIGYDIKPATATASNTPKTADITLVVQGDVKLGPDGLMHDAFTPCNFTVYTDQEVNLTVINYDDGEHSLLAQPWG